MRPFLLAWFFAASLLVSRDGSAAPPLGDKRCETLQGASALDAADEALATGQEARALACHLRALETLHGDSLEALALTRAVDDLVDDKQFFSAEALLDGHIGLEDGGRRRKVAAHLRAYRMVILSYVYLASLWLLAIVVAVRTRALQPVKRATTAEPQRAGLRTSAKLWVASLWLGGASAGLARFFESTTPATPFLCIGASVPPLVFTAKILLRSPRLRPAAPFAASLGVLAVALAAVYAASPAWLAEILYR